jgi:hypothetical protein
MKRKDNMIVIDPEILIVLAESDCREERVICELLDVFVLPAKKADGSGYRLCTGVVANGRFRLLDISKSGNVYRSIKKRLDEFCSGNSMNVDELKYKGVVIGDDIFALLYGNDSIEKRMIRDSFYVIRRLWLF